ncbi:class I SAM-dependent methyltransferase [Rhodoblastus sp.]|uniref:class I SAM-dependent methyltransferase n=1 Tax=Rhodoblastus sp. TaxID=1962975 RepID=UPI003F98D052
MIPLRATTQTELTYPGAELDAFAEAINWKKYWSRKLRAYVSGSVIEVGAGLGGSTKYLCNDDHSQWLCLDPDPTHASHLKSLIAAGELPASCEVICGVLGDLDPGVRVDTILYIDVLEHIEKDEDELRLAAAHLKPGGRAIVLSPAFNSLYSEFDRAVGHHRRYIKRDAQRLTVQSLSLQRTFYLDSVGFFASLINRLFLRKSTPTKSQLRLWDRGMVPISIYTDMAFGSLFGKTIVMVWQKI